MLCMKCHRYITKPAALSGGLPVGPVCAVRLGLVAPRPGKQLTPRGRWKAFWQAQMDLFEGVIL